MWGFRSRSGAAAPAPALTDLSQAPLALQSSGIRSSFLGENLEVDAQLKQSIMVSGAGDARANGIYRRCGTQNEAPCVSPASGRRGDSFFVDSGRSNGARRARVGGSAARASHPTGARASQGERHDPA